jgi:ATP-binding cassette subfamily D (ALD) long-chain fatty acid import protein
MLIALITISTRASLKKYHTYTLTLGMGDDSDDWEFQRIGTESEKSSVEKELAELRKRLAKVEEWKNRKAEIEEELNRVWVKDGNDEESGELAPPSYLESEAATRSEEDEEEEEDGMVEEEESPASEAGDNEQAVESGSGSGSGSPHDMGMSGSWSPQFRPNS